MILKFDDLDTYDAENENNTDDFRFALAPVEDPQCFVKTQAAEGDAHTQKLMAFNRGTTTLAFRFKGGIIVACDSRASQNSYIASQHVRKILPITKYIVGTMAGGAADCWFWERVLAKLCRIHELRNGEPITVAHASKLLANIFFQYRGYGLSCGTMVCGYNVQTQTTSIISVDDTGERCKGDLFSVGSGSLYAYGVLDAEWRFDLDLATAVELGRRAIFQATHRDGASGGLVRVYVIDEKGWKIHVEGDDVRHLYDEYYPTSKP